jgi:hypothetical protein
MGSACYSTADHQGPARRGQRRNTLQGGRMYGSISRSEGKHHRGRCIHGNQYTLKILLLRLVTVRNMPRRVWTMGVNQGTKEDIESVLKS